MGTADGALGRAADHHRPGIGRGAAGSRLSGHFGIPVSRHTLLRLVRRQPLPDAPLPAMLGVDDWAYRKRQTYGTILVDLAQSRPIALLADREADTLAGWLRAHPGVKIVTRDRSIAYAEGTRAGAPQAIQVADRFHLLQNLSEALDQVFSAHGSVLTEVKKQLESEPLTREDGTVTVPVPPTRPLPLARQRAEQRRARRLANYTQVWDLHRHGWSDRVIARQLGLGRMTVTRYLQAPVFPERKGRSDQGRSLLDPYKTYLLERWNAGQRETLPLLREIQRQGYSGSYATQDKLQFPFTAECIGQRAISPLRLNEMVKVIAMAPEEDCEHEMFIQIQRKKEDLAVPLAQLRPVTADEETVQAVEDWHYWVRRGYQF